MDTVSGRVSAATWVSKSGNRRKHTLSSPHLPRGNAGSDVLVHALRRGSGLPAELTVSAVYAAGVAEVAGPDRAVHTALADGVHLRVRGHWDGGSWGRSGACRSQGRRTAAADATGLVRAHAVHAIVAEGIA